MKGRRRGLAAKLHDPAKGFAFNKTVAIYGDHDMRAVRIFRTLATTPSEMEFDGKDTVETGKPLPLQLLAIAGQPPPINPADALFAELWRAVRAGDVTLFEELARVARYVKATGGAVVDPARNRVLDYVAETLRNDPAHRFTVPELMAHAPQWTDEDAARRSFHSMGIPMVRPGRPRKKM